MDRVFCLSDTFDSNKKMLENLEIRSEDILSPNEPDAVDKIVAEIYKERDDLLEYREKVKRWKSFNKKLDINNLDDLLEFYDPVTRQIEPPKHRYDGRKPSSVGLSRGIFARLALCLFRFRDHETFQELVQG